jgi:hypothetical protein
MFFQSPERLVVLDVELVNSLSVLRSSKVIISVKREIINIKVLSLDSQSKVE